MPDPYLEQQQSEEVNDLKATSEGCLFAVLAPILMAGLGLVLSLVLFASLSGPAKSNRVLGMLCLFAALGLLLGALNLLRKVAPGVYLRGLFGLPGLPLSPRSAKIGLRDLRALRSLTGIVTCLLIYLSMLALVSFLMNVNEPLGSGLLWAGLLLGPAAGALAAARTALHDPLEPEYD